MFDSSALFGKLAPTLSINPAAYTQWMADHKMVRRAVERVVIPCGFRFKEFLFPQ